MQKSLFHRGHFLDKVAFKGEFLFLGWLSLVADVSWMSWWISEMPWLYFFFAWLVTFSFYFRIFSTSKTVFKTRFFCYSFYRYVSWFLLRHFRKLSWSFLYFHEFQLSLGHSVHPAEGSVVVGFFWGGGGVVIPQYTLCSGLFRRSNTWNTWTWFRFESVSQRCFSIQAIIDCLNGRVMEKTILSNFLFTTSHITLELLSTLY